MAEGRHGLAGEGDRESHNDSVERLLRVREVAGILNLSERAVWRLRADGTLPAVRVGGAVRFRIADVRTLINSNP